MKVCILTKSMEWGGTEIHTVGLAEELEKRGHEVSIIQFEYDLYSQRKLQLSSKVRLVYLNIPKPIIELSLLESVRLFKKLDADICIFEKGDFEAGSWRFHLAARFCFRRYITIEQLTCEPMPPKQSKRHLRGLVPGMGLWWYRCLWDRYLRSLGPHRIISVSDYTRGQLIEECRFPAHKLTTIHNGLDAQKFQPNLKLRQAMRSHWGIPHDALVYGAVGRLNEVKGYDLAIELFSRLISDFPHRDLRLVLAGEGPFSDVLRRMIKEAGLERHVFLPGFAQRPWKVYPAFDVFVMPSLNEGLPIALLEAMTCGCCPIAMGAGGIPEVITDPDLGWLVQAGDRGGFFEAMTAAAQSSAEELGAMGRRAREHVISRFDSQVQFSKLADLIEMEFKHRNNLYPFSVPVRKGSQGVLERKSDSDAPATEPREWNRF